MPKIIRTRQRVQQFNTKPTLDSVRAISVVCKQFNADIDATVLRERYASLCAANELQRFLDMAPSDMRYIGELRDKVMHAKEHGQECIAGLTTPIRPHLIDVLRTYGYDVYVIKPEFAADPGNAKFIIRFGKDLVDVATRKYDFHRRTGACEKTHEPYFQLEDDSDVEADYGVFEDQ